MNDNSHTQNMDMRAFPRQDMKLPIEICLWHRDEATVVHCDSDNISLRGAHLQTKELGFPKFRTLEIRILNLIDESLPATQRILAKAVRATDTGLAIEFRRTSNRVLKALHKHLLSAR